VARADDGTSSIPDGNATWVVAGAGNWPRMVMGTIGNRCVSPEFLLRAPRVEEIAVSNFQRMVTFFCDRGHCFLFGEGQYLPISFSNSQEMRRMSESRLGRRRGDRVLFRARWNPGCVTSEPVASRPRTIGGP